MPTPTQLAQPLKMLLLWLLSAVRYSGRTLAQIGGRSCEHSWHSSQQSITASCSGLDCIKVYPSVFLRARTQHLYRYGLDLRRRQTQLDVLGSLHDCRQIPDPLVRRCHQLRKRMLPQVPPMRRLLYPRRAEMRQITPRKRRQQGCLFPFLLGLFADKEKGQSM